MLFFLIWFLFLCLPQPLFAADITVPIVSVVNPIRGPQLGLEKSDIGKSLRSQWSVTRQAGIKATWLWQYSALEEESMVKLARNEMKDPFGPAQAIGSEDFDGELSRTAQARRGGQEFGIFLEIDKNFAEKAGVVYKGQSSWYFSDGIFLVSYDIFEREKLIDTVFEKFHTTFGYYPKTVGAWWVGAQSIDYMQRKYGITGVIQCADQFGTDAYSIWGTPWSIPYRPDSTNAALPASSLSESSEVVVMQWAPRDPTQGYGKDVEASTFSMQDYPMKGYEHTYIDHLAAIYLKKPLDQMVFGLEAGLPNSSYEAIYGKQIVRLKELEQQKKFSIQPVSEYSEKFLSAGLTLPPTSYFLADGYKNPDQSFWMNTPSYRVGIKREGNFVYLMDLRDYTNSSSEDFYHLPNLEGLLRIQTRSRIDSIRFPQQRTLLANDIRHLTLEREDGKTVLKGDSRVLGIFTDKDFTFPTLPESQQESLSLGGNSGIEAVSLFLLKQPIWILWVVVLLYVAFLLQQKYPTQVISLTLASLLISIFFSYQYFSTWYTASGNIVFSGQALLLFPLAALFPFPPPLKLLIIFQLLPFFLLLSVNYLFLRLSRRRKSVWIFYFILLFVICIAASQSYEAFLELFGSGKKRLLLALAISLLIIGLWGMIVRLSFNAKKRMLAFVLAGMIVAGTAGVTFPKLFSEKRIVIAPFEMEALLFVYQQNKPALFLRPDPELLYRAVSPLLYSKPEYASFLMANSWSVGREGGNNKGRLFIVPRYLKKEVPAEDRKKRLEKVFDNAQIEIYNVN